MDSSGQCITTAICSSLGNFWFHGVCGLNIGIERRSLWAHLSFLQVPAGSSWVLASGFNVVANAIESEP